MPIAYRRDRQRNIQSLAVLRNANRLEMLDPFPAPDALQDVILFRAPLGRNDQKHRLTDRFGR